MNSTTHNESESKKRFIICFRVAYFQSRKVVSILLKWSSLFSAPLFTLFFNTKKLSAMFWRSYKSASANVCVHDENSMKTDYQNIELLKAIKTNLERSSKKMNRKYEFQMNAEVQVEIFYDKVSKDLRDFHHENSNSFSFWLVLCVCADVSLYIFLLSVRSFFPVLFFRIFGNRILIT